MLSTCNKDNWVGWYQFLSIYQLALIGTEDGRHQGIILIDLDTNEEYLHLYPEIMSEQLLMHYLNII